MKFFVQKYLFSSKCFCGHIECRYDNPSERKKNTKVLSIFAQCPEMRKIIISNKKKFSSKCSSGHLESSFKNSEPKFSLIGQNVFRPMPEKERKHNFVFKKFNRLEKFCWNWWMQFLRTFRKISCQLKKIFARCAKVLINFFQNNSSKMFFWTRTVSFRQVFWKCPASRLELFWSTTEKDTKILL